MSNKCNLCARVRALKEKKDSAFIYEFETSLLILGDHQFFKGYSVLILKDHAREIFDLPQAIQIALALEVSRASKAITQAFRPRKVNLASLGNQDPHVHWHIFPRYATDQDPLTHPWAFADQFKNSVGDERLRLCAISEIQKYL